MIQIENLSIRLPGFVLRDICLHVTPGEFFTLLGPTGAGKTLILDALVGIIPVTGGHILINGREVTGLPPERREIGIVYQDNALFPHLSVGENIRYGLRYRQKDRRKTGLNTDKLTEWLGIRHLSERSVLNLSGGEKQRVALARALATEPSVLLLDEPLSALDPNFRADIRDRLRRLHRETGVTVLMVTHDFTEAHFLARRTAILNRGRIEQTGPVREVFQRPVNPFVADFVGMKNIFPATLKRNVASVGTLRICLAAGATGDCIAIRPEDIRVLPADSADGTENHFPGEVTAVSSHGIYCDLCMQARDVHFRAILPYREVVASDLREGSRVTIAFDPADVHVLRSQP
ncbi:hypothetical protein DENIS_0593 [Desulfonema ishimotonii]|uniref:ABC transporter domain-containing protein n=1 Tax=Desulfonema ishimotonii TaxID=45657 RepID=A0A401FRQ5_9BACT|nr:ABC transporter ATP-binding protein [Desulfonema ishimotonii]GBC59652.1 hypothetical protein DENIS_0593 [Desulfonema ishimotonii]